MKVGALELSSWFASCLTGPKVSSGHPGRPVSLPLIPPTPAAVDYFNNLGEGSSEIFNVLDFSDMWSWFMFQSLMILRSPSGILKRTVSIWRKLLHNRWSQKFNGDNEAAQEEWERLSDGGGIIWVGPWYSKFRMLITVNTWEHWKVKKCTKTFSFVPGVLSENYKWCSKDPE